MTNFIVKNIKMWKHITSFCFSLLFCTSIVFAQQGITVTGTVSDYGGTLPGVNVVVKGTLTGVVTDIDGKYEITVPNADAVLAFSFVGFNTTEMVVGAKRIIDVLLTEDAQMIEEVVVVAYGTRKKENLSGAVSVVNVEKAFESRPASDVGRALQGATAGLSISTQSGTLGGDPNIRLRSHYVSMGSGNANPLILVDHVEVPSLSYVNPNDIESISTLKDAASASLYGARAANGVILITTKKGSKDGKVKVSYTNNLAWATKTKVPVHTRPDLELDYSWKQRNGSLERRGDNLTSEFNQIGPIFYNQDMIKKVKKYWDDYGYGKGLGDEMVEGRDFEKRPGGGFYFYRGWDLEDEYYRKWAPMQTHNLSVSGGNDIVTYNLSGGYMKQGGVLKQFDDYYSRLNTSGNVRVQANKYLSFRSGFMASKTEQASPFVYNATSDWYDAAYYMYRWFSTYPGGTYKGKELRTGLQEHRQANKNPTINENWYNRINLGATLHIMDGLTANFDYTYNRTMWSRERIGGIISYIDAFTNTTAGADLDERWTVNDTNWNYVRMDNSKNMRNAYKGNVNYDNKFGKHHVNVIVGMEMEDAEYKMYWSRRDNVTDFNLPELGLSLGAQSVGSDHTWWSIVGVFGRINYIFDNKYIVEFNFRRDASSKFKDGMRWASYPSGSFAWRVSEESFWEPIKSYVNIFKLRASYGSIGNQSMTSQLYYPTIPQGTNTGDPNTRYWLVNQRVANWVGGPSGVPSTGGPAVVNPDLTWETITTLDFGLDTRFWKDMFGLSLGWYEKKTTDVITQGDALPSSFGTAAPRVNYGAMSTKGVELELTFDYRFDNNFKVNASVMFNDYKTKVTKFASVGNPLYNSTYYEGKTMGEIWGYKVERLFQKDDFVWDGDNLATTTVNSKTIFQLKNLPTDYQEFHQNGISGFSFAPGDVMYKDLNGDNKITEGDNRIGSELGTGDRTIIGNNQPRYMYSFRLGAAWKGFDFDVFFQGVGKRKLWATGNMILPGFMGSEANFTHTLDYWTETNTGAFYPRPFDFANGGSIRNYLPNDRYILNLAYLRCKTLTFGYTLPIQMTQKAMISRARIYFTGENLFEFDKLGKIAVDPEIDWVDGGTANDGRSYGRSYPYRRILSFGIQVDF